MCTRSCEACSRAALVCLERSGGANSIVWLDVRVSAREWRSCLWRVRASDVGYGAVAVWLESHVVWSGEWILKLARRQCGASAPLCRGQDSASLSPLAQAGTKPAEVAAGGCHIMSQSILVRLFRVLALLIRQLKPYATVRAALCASRASQTTPFAAVAGERICAVAGRSHALAQMYA